MGPGVILIATAVGSGEILFWPGIVANYGFQFVWLILTALTCQYVLNTEFVRYTLATGEPVVAGYVRLWRGFRWVFLAATILPWVWPGWATGGAQALQWLFGGEVRWIAAASLVIIGLLLSSTRLVYRALETAQAWMIGYVLVVLALVTALVVRPDTLAVAAGGLARSPLPFPPDLALPTLLAALVFCGAGGTINLATSNWARDKGFGLAAHASKIVNPLTGATQATGTALFRLTAEPGQAALWRRWWALARREQQVTFLLGGAFGLTAPMLIAYAMVGEKGLGVGLDAVRAQAQQLGAQFGAWLQVGFVIAVAAIFLTSALGVLDHAARLAASLLAQPKERLEPEPGRWRTESGLYFLVLWGLIAVGLVILLGFNVADPPALLTIAGALSGIVMFVYAALTLVLNIRMRRAMDRIEPALGGDNPFRMSWPRTLFLTVGVALYGALSIAVIQDALAKAAA
ncbi:MAG: hypothetical protein A2790_19855 [Phenylobacterium sp. RIFCSPHIGHO2_01_FULL_69_31]|nr:MAG: hypothetical protein A2790_19855 [Phenylobacterium sp. RIFCSPHIGHO2_01_FULL_69_31]